MKEKTKKKIEHIVAKEFIYFIPMLFMGFVLLSIDILLLKSPNQSYLEILISGILRGNIYPEHLTYFWSSNWKFTSWSLLLFPYLFYFFFRLFKYLIVWVLKTIQNEKLEWKNAVLRLTIYFIVLCIIVTVAARSGNITDWYRGRRMDQRIEYLKDEIVRLEKCLALKDTIQFREQNNDSLKSGLTEEQLARIRRRSIIRLQLRQTKAELRREELHAILE
ncbi:MAG: hypothetical protein P9X24_05060 [Candidatus Hatepunaea meridiana]|nr:hypothetical protein [Candidatus Hatepunaea meridiana]